MFSPGVFLPWVLPMTSNQTPQTPGHSAPSDLERRTGGQVISKIENVEGLKRAGFQGRRAEGVCGKLGKGSDLAQGSYSFVFIWL